MKRDERQDKKPHNAAQEEKVSKERKEVNLERAQARREKEGCRERREEKGE